MPVNIVEPVISPVKGGLYSAVATMTGMLDNIVAAAILLIVGVIVGKVIGAAILELLKRFKIDSYVGIKREHLKVSKLISDISRWLIYLLFLSEAAAVLEIQIIANALTSLVNYLPNVLTAILVLTVGYVVARYIEDAIEDTHVAYSGLMSRVFFFFVVYLSAAIALNSLGSRIINTVLVDQILLIIVATFGVGLSIAMGLGFKSMFKSLGDEIGRDLVSGLKRKRKA
ncbi:MAG: hypothetical protein CL963_03540 [Euryarchaeota archaeon]|jgi:hypothetical protein|nr:hypothetical protein [Euryarchaeota archaeon]|tara:strand:- start:14027 stop:14710 length:684 start_codon:yes stop_codon:yes gene_type:complete